MPEAALRAADEFLEHAPCEMRTPMHVIRSFTDLTARRERPLDVSDERLLRSLGILRVGAAQRFRSIEDILELVRLQSDRTILPRPPVRARAEAAVFDTGGVRREIFLIWSKAAVRIGV